MPPDAELTTFLVVLAAGVTLIVGAVIGVLFVLDDAPPAYPARRPLPRSALRELLGDHRSRHPSGVPLALLGAEDLLGRRGG